MARDSTIAFGNIAAVKKAFTENRFIAHDNRELNIDALDDRHQLSKAKIYGLKRVFETIDETALENLHESESDEIGRYALELFNTMGTVQRNVMSTGRLEAQTIDEINRHFSNITTTLAPLLLVKLVAERGRATKDVAQLKQQTNDFLSSAKLESDELISSVRREISEAAIGRNSNFFHDEARRYSIQSIAWGISLAMWMVFTLATISFIAFNFEIVGKYLLGIRSYVPGISEDTVLLQLGFSKMVGVAILTYVASILSKAFLSSLNLRANNKQRAVALDTYRFLLDGAKADEDRQAIIQRAAEAVFAIPETGLIRSGASSDSGGMNAIFNLPKVSSG